MAIREKVILEGEDRASKAFNEAGGAFEKMGKTLKRVALAGGIAIAANQLARLGGKTLGMAVDAEEAASAFKTAFGEALPEASAFVEEFANKAGFARSELQQMLAITGTVIQGIGATEAESAKLAETMARLAGDVASFSNAEGGAEAVLRALQSAINGEREALKTYGLAIAETEVQERALSNTQKERAADLTRLEKAQATVEIAMEKAGKAMGDLDRTQDSAANTLRRLQAKMREAGEAVGKELLPGLEALLPVMEDMIPVAEDVGRGLASIATTAAILGAQAAPAIAGFFARLGEGTARVSEAAAGASAIVQEVLTFGKADTSTERAFQRAARQAAELSDISQKLAKGQVAGKGAAAQYANALVELAKRSHLSEVAIIGLASASDASREEQLAALQATLELGKTENWRQENILALTDAIITQKIELGLINDEYQDAAFRMRDWADAETEASDAGDDVTTTLTEQEQAALDLAEAAREAASAFRDDLAQGARDFITGFKELPKQTDLTLAKFDKNLRDRIAAQKQFWDNLTALAGAGFDDLAETIREQGPEAAALLEEMVNDMDRAADLETLLDAAELEMGTLADRYASTLESGEIPARFRQAGETDIAAYIEGLRSGNVPKALLDILGDAFTPDRPAEQGRGARSGLAFADGTWNVPGRGPVDAVVHGGEIIIPPPGSTGRADFARELASEIGRIIGTSQDQGPTVQIDQILVTVPAGTTITEAVTAAGAEAAIEAFLS